jgi:hypothetical protein
MHAWSNPGRGVRGLCRPQGPALSAACKSQLHIMVPPALPLLFSWLLTASCQLAQTHVLPNNSGILKCMNLRKSFNWHHRSHANVSGSNRAASRRRNTGVASSSVLHTISMPYIFILHPGQRKWGNRYSILGRHRLSCQEVRRVPVRRFSDIT